MVNSRKVSLLSRVHASAMFAIRIFRPALALFIGLVAREPAQCSPAYSFSDAQQFLNTYCVNCHTGKSPAAGLDVARILTKASLGTQMHSWDRVLARVRNGEMPPKGT